ncbi:hypothetical protein B0H15DRAFT_931459, partial [Mycena belliarum]
MPLARANTSSRNKSRSPLPPSPRPPNFLPPSHYAEAGGITPRQPYRQPTTHEPSSSSSDSHPQYQTQLESRRNSAFMPISSNSDSSFEFAAKPTEKESKRFSMHSGGGSKGGVSSSSPHSRRESHMTNLPLVEAQLLPSLRDTIDRMTRVPSKMLTPTSPPENTNEPSPTSSSYFSMAQLHDDSSHSLSPPPPSATPKSLKSALRAPTPKLRSRSPRLVTPTTPTATIAPQPRSGLENSGQGTWAYGNDARAQPPTRSRARSRTDPGAPPQASRIPTTPIPTSDPRDAKGSSNIPRPRAIPGL